MSLKSIIAGIEHLPEELYEDVESIWNKEKVAYNKLATEAQSYLKQGSGILAEINADLAGPAQPIVDLILSKWGVTDAQVVAVLTKVAKTFNLIETDLPTTSTGLVEVVQKYLSGVGGVWSIISSGIALIGADVLNGDTPIAIGLDIIRYVYNEIVKPKIAA